MPLLTMTASKPAITNAAQRPSEAALAWRKDARGAAQRLDALPDEVLSTLGPVQAVALVLGQRWKVFATHQDKTGGWVSCDYEVGVLSFNGGERYAAVLVYNNILTGGHPEKASLWKHATVEHRRAGVQRALRCGSGCDTLVDLVARAQRRTSPWPAPEGLSIPNAVLNAPRIALCRAIMAQPGPEADAVRLLAALGGFVGENESGEWELLSTRLAWHRSQETMLAYHEDFARRQIAHWDASPEDVPTPRRTWFMEGGSFVIGSVIARTPAMLDNPPLDATGLVEHAYFMRQVEAYLTRSDTEQDDPTRR